MKKFILFLLISLSLNTTSLLIPSSSSALACGRIGGCNTGSNQSDCPINQECKSVDLGDGSFVNECVLCNAPPTCKPIGASCTGADTCCVGSCNGNVCGCKPENASCTTGSDCCGGSCNAGKCSEPGAACLGLQGSCVPNSACIYPQTNEGARDCPSGRICCRDRSMGDIVEASDPSCDGGNGVNTAFGCLNITGTATITTLASWGTGIAVGIAVLLIILASIQIASSAGDAKRVKAGQELLTSALAGLFLISLSIVLLNFIGVNILSLDLFGFRP